jgi:predicted dehydrogenase
MALRIALVGAGRRGREWAREIAVAPGFELAAYVDADEAALRRATGELGLAGSMCFASLGEALDAVACDAALVATPPDVHRESSEIALERGLGLLVEKPFTTSLDDAIALVELGERRGAPIVVGQNLRYTRAHKAVRRVVASGALGRIRMVVVQSYRVPELAQGWRGDADELIVWEVAVHHLDALRHAIGELSGVVAESFGSTPGHSLHAMLAFENGARGLYSATYESSGHEFFERGQEYYERVVGDRATLHVFHRWLVLCPRGGLPRLVRRGKREVSEERVLLDQLGRALETGELPECGGADNLRTVAVVQACAISAADGRWVDPRELMVARV